MSTQQQAAPASQETSLRLFGLVLLVGLTLVWGATWPVMKIALSELSVWWFRSACLIFGGVGLLTLAALGGQKLTVSPRQIAPLLLTSAFAVAGWHLFSGFGVTMMPAGRAAIIAFTMPVWAALASAWILGERIGPLTIAGLVLGVSGLAVLIGPDLVVFQQAPIGALLMLGSAMSWGIGTVLFKRFAWTTPVITTMGWQLIAAAVPITAIAVASSPPPDVLALSQPVLLSVAYILLLPMTFGQWAYFRVVKLFPASIAALGTLAIPIVGVYSSSILLAEPVGLREIVSLAFTCAALTIILIVPSIFAWRRRRSAQS